MKPWSTDFRVTEGDRVNLDKWPTAVEPIYESKKHYQKILANHVDQLSSLQQLLYASNRCALLLIFQALDAAGKDGAIRHVMSRVNLFIAEYLTALSREHSRRPQPPPAWLVRLLRLVGSRDALAPPDLVFEAQPRSRVTATNVQTISRVDGDSLSDIRSTFDTMRDIIIIAYGDNDQLASPLVVPLPEPVRRRGNAYLRPHIHRHHQPTPNLIFTK